MGGGSGRGEGGRGEEAGSSGGGGGRGGRRKGGRGAEGGGTGGGGGGRWGEEKEDEGTQREKRGGRGGRRRARSAGVTYKLAGGRLSRGVACRHLQTGEWRFLFCLPPSSKSALSCDSAAHSQPGGRPRTKRAGGPPRLHREGGCVHTVGEGNRDSSVWGELELLGTRRGKRHRREVGATRGFCCQDRLRLGGGDRRGRGRSPEGRERRRRSR